MPAKSVLKLLKVMKRIALWSVTITCMAVTGLAQITVAPAPAATTPPGYRVEEKRLGPWELLLLNPSQYAQLYETFGFKTQMWRSKPAAFNPRLFALGSDGHHVARIINGGRSHVNFVLDGHPITISDGALPGSEAIGLDGKHVRVAYIQHIDTKLWAVVADGRMGTGYEEIINGSVIFSPDGKHLAYGAKVGKQWTTVVDGKPSTQYDDIGSPIFSPDSKRVAYAAHREKMWSVVVDGHAGLECDEIIDLQFSADSQHVAYVAKRDKSWFVVVDDHAGTQYEQVERMKINSDGRRVAYAARTSKSPHWPEVVEEWAYGEEGAHVVKTEEIGIAGDARIRDPGLLGAIYTNPTGYTASFSPDGKRLAYVSVLEKGEKSPVSVIMDGEAGPKFKDVRRPVFSSDGKHMAYAAMTMPEKIEKGVYSANNSLVVFDGQLGEKYLCILDGSLTFNPDGTMEFLALSAKSGGDHPIPGITFLFGSPTLYRVRYIPADWRPPTPEPDVQPKNLPVAAPAVSHAQAPVEQISLTIDSTPTGADIEVDGAFVGNTPSTVGVAPGKHQIAVKMKGYSDWSKNLNVTGGSIHLSAELEKVAQ